MDDLVVSLPTMWADHHVLKVREALARAPGVANVAASAKDRSAHVSYDPATTSAGDIVAALEAAGYETEGTRARDGGDEAAAPDVGGAPEWSAAPRITTTSAVDLTMSGDYRKY